MTKSVRIKNSNGDKATIWPVGVRHYSVKWDNEQVTHTIASSDVDKSFYYGSWKEIEEGFTESVTYHQGEKIITNDAYKGNLSVKMDISSENNLLQTIKQFVEEFDAQVAMCKEGYLIYSDNETIDPYRANSDEELKEILQAIRVLKKYEGV